MLARNATRLPKAVRQISSSSPARVLQQTPSSSGRHGEEQGVPAVSQGEQAWCEIYGVDYEKEIQEALKETPAMAPPAPAKKVNYPTAATEELSASTLLGGLNAPAKPQNKADIWNVVFGAPLS